jgi:hypothetical protein
MQGGVQTLSFGYRLGTSCIFGCVEVKPARTCTFLSGSSQSGNAQESLPLTGLTVALLDNGIKVAEAATGPTGCYEFLNLGCGNFSLQFPTVFQGRSLTSLPDGIQALGFLPPGTQRTAPNITYDGAAALRSVRGRLVLQSGAGVRADVTLVEVDSNYNPKDGTDRTTSSDESGSFSFENLTEGDYELSAPPTLDSGLSVLNVVNVTAARCLLTVSGSDVVVPDIVYRTNPLIDAVLQQVGGIRQAAATLATIGPPGPQAAPLALTAPAGGTAYNQVVNAGVAQVLGSSSIQTPAQVMTLLNNAFAAKTDGARTYYVWRPRGVVTGGSPADGQVLGAQATLYQEARDIQDAAERLLDSVEPTILDPDLEDIAAFQDNIRNTLETIVSEIGRTGGAVTQRVDALMTTLQDDVTTLKDKLGLNAAQSSLQLDMDLGKREQDQQNFTVLERHLGSNGQLQTLWNEYKVNVARFIGTQLTRLSWTIEAIPDTVQSIYAAMDSVGFGAADRRVTPIISATPISASNSITIEQLLLWIESAASADWPTRLAAGGARKSEVQAVGREAGAQQGAVQVLITNLAAVIPVGSDRVRAVLEELNRELHQVNALAGQIAPSP